MKFPRNILLLAAAALCLSYMTSDGYAQDSLRIIELSGPGESAPVNVPAGHAFTFSLFTPASGSIDYDAAVGVIDYAEPDPFVKEVKWLYFYQVERWYLGPANVRLKSSAEGARMQLYVVKLPRDVISGVLNAESPIHAVNIPKGSLLTPLLGFSSLVAGVGDFHNYLVFRRPDGVSYGYASMNPELLGSPRIGSPRLRGIAQLHNPSAPASSVVSGFFYEDFGSVSPTADFVGPGTATFSLPPESDRGTPIAFYCYRITPANVIGADASPPVVKVTAPKTATASTGASSYVLKGSVTDNINATSVRFRVRGPKASTYGNWDSVNLGGDSKTKSWQRTISLARKGAWRVQVQALDGEQNASTVQTITLTRQ